MNYNQLSSSQLVNAFEEGFGQSASGLWWGDCSKVIGSVTDEVMRAVALGQSGGLRRHIPGRAIDQQALIGYKLDTTVDIYSDGYPIPLRALGANPQIWMDKAREMGESVRYDLQRLVVDHVVGNKLAIDGVAMFGAHSIGIAGSQTNALTSSQVSVLNVGTPATPTVEEAVDIINGVTAYMQAYKGEAGRVVTAGQRVLVIVTNTAAHYDAFSSAVVKEILAGGVTNVLAAKIRSGVLKIRVELDTAMTGSNKVRFFGGTPGFKPFIIGLDGPRDTSNMNPDSDNAKKLQAVEFQVTADIAICFNAFYTAAEATLS